jgi:transposase InsO family protein
LKDSYSTISQHYCGVPRKAIRLFAAKCHVCNRVEKRQRNKRPPRAIQVSEVRQRYTLDLIDLQSWQQQSTGEGRKKRYVAHMIDHSSKLRWGEPIAQKSAAAVLEVVRRVFKDFGQPAILHTDNGTEFANSQLEEECRLWGTRIIHGRPYHPQSQGVVERANGVLKNAMRKYQRSNPSRTDWTFVLSQVMWRLNTQVHSVTGMAPQEHFQKFNHFSRQVNPLGSNDRVVITVAEVATIPALQWIEPCDVTRDDEPEQVPELDEEEEVQSAATPQPMFVQQTDGEVSEEGDVDEEKAMEDVQTLAAAIPPTAKPQLQPPVTVSSVVDKQAKERKQKAAQQRLARPLFGTTATSASASSAVSSTAAASASGSAQPSMSLRQRRPVVINPTLSGFHILPAGQVGEFVGPEWDRDLVPHVRAWMRRVGSIANGDCGPASAYFVQHGSVATERQADQLRSAVLAWSNTTEGQLYYAEHEVGELQQRPSPLAEMQEMWARPLCWVTTEFLTCFGGMLGLNVFLLSRCTSPDGSVHAGVRLVTNGGLLLKTDEANCCCIYFQYKSPEQVGHFEPVRDKQGRHRWRADDQTIQECLWRAMRKGKMARSVRDMRKKQLVAAHNRVNLSNETIQVGDCAWLTVPPEIVSSAVQQLKNRRDKVGAADGKLLVKIARVITHQASANDSSLPTQHFAVWSDDGPIESTFSIDQLQRCHPPPEASMYKVVELELPKDGEPAPKSKPMKLVKAYKRYLTLLATRAAIVGLAARSQVDRAVHVATSINSTLNGQDLDLAGSMVSMRMAASRIDVQPVEVDKPMTPPPESDSPSPKPKTLIDIVPYPCTHCGMTVEFSECVFCFYDPCHAPFHLPGTGCAKADKVFVVNTTLLYCRQACAVLDQTGSGNGLVQPLEAASSALPEVQKLEETQEVAVVGGTVQSQTVEVGMVKSIILCKSCEQPVVWQKGTGCDRCSSYHHKVRRNQEGCTREGWSKGGSRNVQGIVECVECRFTGDADWKRFREQSGLSVC